MKYIDPMPLTCNRCSSSSQQSVADLLSLRATCPTCGKALDEVGRQMRAQSDDVTRWATVIAIAVELEDVLGEEFTDAELEEVLTLRDLACVVGNRLPDDSQARVDDLVREAAKLVPWCAVSDPNLDAPIFVAIDPDRWNRL